MYKSFRIKPIKPRIRWIPVAVAQRLTYGNYHYKHRRSIVLLSNRPLKGVS